VSLVFSVLAGCFLSCILLGLFDPQSGGHKSQLFCVALFAECVFLFLRGSSYDLTLILYLYVGLRLCDALFWLPFLAMACLYVDSALSTRLACMCTRIVKVY
jgi:hypothetical protein